MIIYYLGREGSAAVVISKNPQSARMYIAMLARSHGASDPMGWLLDDVTTIAALGVATEDKEEGIVLLHNDPATDDRV